MKDLEKVKEAFKKKFDICHRPGVGVQRGGFITNKKNIKNKVIKLQYQAILGLLRPCFFQVTMGGRVLGGIF